MKWIQMIAIKMELENQLVQDLNHLTSYFFILNFQIIKNVNFKIK
jgi:hypothetical protein